MRAHLAGGMAVRKCPAMNRSVLVDLFKALASQLIVLHHTFLYSPMADWIAQAWPTLVQFIVEDGRFAVQPFLVMGGFLTAQALLKRRERGAFDLIFQRYLRLAPPLGFALLLVAASTAMVGDELADQEWVSDLPSFSALVIHLFFLQDLLDEPSLLAGAWYVAIDLQLFILFVALVCFVQRFQRDAMNVLVPTVLALASGASIFVFSRDSDMDIWAIYFLSAYGLGALAAWAGSSGKARGLWWITVALVLADYLMEPRERPIWALTTALALHAGHQWSWHLQTGLLSRVIQSLSTWSYGVFVAHFVVIILASGLWFRFDLTGLGAALAATLLVLVASLGLGASVQAFSDWLVKAGLGGRVLRKFAK